MKKKSKYFVYHITYVVAMSNDIKTIYVSNYRCHVLIITSAYSPYKEEAVSYYHCLNEQKRLFTQERKCIHYAIVAT
jgi:hypothetical protein